MSTQYELSLPEGWRRYVLADANAAKRLVADTHPSLMNRDDRDAVLVRHRVIEDAVRAFEVAIDAGAADLYTFDRIVAGARLTMLFTVGVAFLGPNIDAGALRRVVAELQASGEDATSFEIPVGRVVRLRTDDRLDLVPATREARRSLVSATEQVTARLAAVGQELGSVPESEARTAVTYLVPAPDEAGLFAVLSCRVFGEEHREARVNHFDLLMAGFSWRR